MSGGALATAFGAGMLATVNPCGFAMLPAYLSSFLGLEQDDDADTATAVLRAVRFWCNRFGPMFAAEIGKRWVNPRPFSRWRRHTDSTLESAALENFRVRFAPQVMDDDERPVARGEELEPAIENAKKFVESAIENAKALGAGARVLGLRPVG